MSLAEQYDRIERYLQGAMPPGELDEFTQKIAADAELAAAVDLHREVAETLAGEQIHQFRETLKQVDSNWKYSAGGNWLRVLRSPQNLAIAASLLLLIGFFSWLALQEPVYPEIASSNFEQLPLQTQMGSNTSDAQVLRNEANRAYITEDYDLAAEKFRTLSGKVPSDQNYRLYQGISEIGSEQLEAAITTLKPLADGNDQSVRGEAAWYLALAYLKLDDSSAARPYLEKLSESKGFRWEQAQSIINMMD